MKEYTGTLQVHVSLTKDQILNWLGRSSTTTKSNIMTWNIDDNSINDETPAYTLSARKEPEINNEWLGTRSRSLKMMTIN